MDKILRKLITATFTMYFFALPLIIFPKTSEIFEFNKMVYTYLITIILSSIWILRMIVNKRIIFEKTKLDLPLILFLCSQFLATVFSIDMRTSIFGYYSRFNGGFLSSISYVLLYWIFVSNMDRLKSIKVFYSIFVSTLLSGIWAIFEHYGHSFSCLIFPDFNVFDVSCWVQDVRTRVYSSFGQPNWLAAWLTAIIPLTWAISLNYKTSITHFKSFSNFKSPIYKLIIFTTLSLIFFITLLFTKSRSGILAFCISFAIFWGLYLWTNKDEIKKSLLFLILTTAAYLLITLVVGSPWTPKLSELVSANPNTSISQPVSPTGPALEVGGGTESGIIRKIVWKGAIDIWKKYPIFGSGVETFAFSYYGSRPVEHNLVSEWDYLYNKAHNEYLNYLATTGTVGFMAYLFLIFSTVVLLTKAIYIQDKSVTQETRILSISLLSGYLTILITNFFGFSVVPISALFFLIPAFSAALSISNEDKESYVETYDPRQKLLFSFVFLITIYLLLSTTRYWNADLTYARGKYQNDSQNYQLAFKTLTELVKTTPNEPVYWDELADTMSTLAINSAENKDIEMTRQLASSAIADGNLAITLSPANVNLKRKQASRLISISAVDQNYLLNAKNILEQAIVQAPTDARIFYNLGLAYLRTGDYDKAIKTLEKTVELKPDYEKAHFALALMYEDVNQKEKAKDHLDYILTKLNPGSAEARRELDEIDK